jgi:hypothetical protein
VRRARQRLGPPPGPGLLALRHALTFRPSHVLGDHGDDPVSLLLLREGDGRRLDAFAAGAHGRGVSDLVGMRRPFRLHGPEAWRDALDQRFGAAERLSVTTWSLPGPTPPTLDTAPTVRCLTAADAAPFLGSAPSWALRGWETFEELIRHGAAFGVAHAGGFAALAWVFDAAGRFASVGAFTAPRFRRLGLARAAASVLVGHLVARGLSPLWSASPDNDASLGLAQSLGFEPAATEPIVGWTPGGEEGR